MEPGQLEEQLKAVPANPGVYLLRDRAGNVLYVGKAASLHHRLRAYFGPASALLPKLRRMVALIGDFEFFVTDSEQEALILECNLIKRYRARYNVRLKDDKSYPYLKIDLAEEWPRVHITRRLEGNGGRYFGPFASAGSVRQTLGVIKKLFPFRSCTRAITGSDPRPCLEYDIHRCLGPCIGAVSREEYTEVIRQVILFLQGKQELVVRKLRAQMEAAARELDFERAALVRDQIRAVEQVTERQKMASPTMGDQDVIALAQARDQACAEVFFVRNGKLLGREHFILEGVQGEEPGLVITSFLKQFYSSAATIPPLILLQRPADDMAVIALWLRGRRGARVELRVPRRGQKRELVAMVAENARQALEQLRLKQMAAPNAIAAALDELEEQLHLPRTPRRVECYDISNVLGGSATGSMVVFEEGLPKRSGYRRFRIKTVAAANDCAMIQEVLRRRFGRGGHPPAQGGDEPPSGAEVWSIIPDLVLIDGGRGQLSAALEAMLELGVSFVPTAALAKENEAVFVPEVAEPILLPRNSPALFLLQRVRDEAHRFALGYHRKLRRRQSLLSTLDSVPGIGPKRKRALIRRFGSIGAIREAPLEELAAVMGMTRSLAERVKRYL
jgi:excinuclease ABC subunit C